MKVKYEEDKITFGKTRKLFMTLRDGHRSSAYRFLTNALLAFHIFLLTACTLEISTSTSHTQTPAPTKITLPTARPTFTTVPTRTAYPTYTPHPTSTATLTPTPSPITPSATPTRTKYAGTISISKFIGDAGNFALQAGEITTLTWEEPPQGATYYEFLFIHEHEDQTDVLDVDYDDSDGVSIDWWVPEHLVGELEALAHYPDGHIIYAIWGGTIYSGSYPPQGFCSMRSASVGVVDIFPSPNINQPEMAYLEPGTYAQVFERYANGWYLISTSEVSFLPDQTQKPDRGWVNEREAFRLHGPCDELPLI